MTKRTQNLLLRILGVLAVVILIGLFFRSCKDTESPEPTFTDLSITKQIRGASPVHATDSVVYQIVYANNGNQAASRTVVIETVPEGATFDSDNNAAAWFCDAVTAGSTCTLSLDILGGGSTGSVDFPIVLDAVLPDDLREIVNEVSISDVGSSKPDSIPGNNRAVVRTPIAVDSTDIGPPPDSTQIEPPTPEPTGIFCELCSDALERNRILDAYVNDYRRQCERCPDLIDRDRQGYTLIVSSQLDRDAAEKEYRRFRECVKDTTLPVSVIVAPVEGILRYRVALGQTETQQEAAALKDRLADDLPACVLPDDAWILRIP